LYNIIATLFHIISRRDIFQIKMVSITTYCAIACIL